VTSEAYGVSLDLLAALNHQQIVISDEMGFQITYVKMEEKWSEVSYIPALLTLQYWKGLDIVCCCW